MTKLSTESSTKLPTKLALFTEHNRAWQSNRYVYPVISRRSGGLSIGVNLNPDKVCNFDCIYCCVDRTAESVGLEARPPNAQPDAHVDLNVLRDELNHMLDLAQSGEIFQSPPLDQTPAALRRLNDVAFSGDGEPTSFKGFSEACQIAADALERHGMADVKIVVITNATLLQRPTVAAALDFLDAHNGEIWAKLEAGTEDYYKLVERTTIPLARVLENIAAAGARRPIVIQSLFMRIHGQPPPPAEIDAYLARLGELQARGCAIKAVQVYTVARRTTEHYVTPLTDGEVDAIAQRVRALGLHALAYYGPD